MLLGTHRRLGRIMTIERAAHGHSRAVKRWPNAHRPDTADDQEHSRPQKKPSQPPATRWLRRR
jgi:hypothetical protein